MLLYVQRVTLPNLTGGQGQGGGRGAAGGAPGAGQCSGAGARCADAANRARGDQYETVSAVSSDKDIATVDLVPIFLSMTVAQIVMQLMESCRQAAGRTEGEGVAAAGRGAAAGNHRCPRALIYPQP